MQSLAEVWAAGMRFQGFLLTPSELGDILISKSRIFSRFFSRMTANRRKFSRATWKIVDLLISVDLTLYLQIAVKSKLLGVDRRYFLWLQVVFQSFSPLVI